METPPHSGTSRLYNSDSGHRIQFVYAYMYYIVFLLAVFVKFKSLNLFTSYYLPSLAARPYFVFARGGGRKVGSSS